jgi:hypothetical protein
MKKLGIKYGEKDNDQKKNLQLLRDAMDNLTDLEQSQQVQIQTMMNQLDQLHQTMSSQLNKIQKDHAAAVKNFR